MPTDAPPSWDETQPANEAAPAWGDTVAEAPPKWDDTRTDFAKPAPFKGALAGVEQFAGSIPKGLAAGFEANMPVVERQKPNLALSSLAEFGKSLDALPDGKLPPNGDAYIMRQRTPEEVLKAAVNNPLYKIGQTAADAVKLTPAEVERMSAAIPAGAVAGTRYPPGGMKAVYL